VIIVLMQCRNCFFFFQAEDGIRDYKVTGVQTCALPIFIPQRRQNLRRLQALRDDDFTRRHMRNLRVTAASAEGDRAGLQMLYEQIGRASCRERVWRSAVGGSVWKEG